jgi:hypothetical protein
MKNLQKKDLPNMIERNTRSLRFSKFVTGQLSSCDENSKELAEEALFTLDKKIEDYKTFMTQSMKEGIAEIFNQEFSFINQTVKEAALQIAIDEDDSNTAYDIETGQMYYKSADAEIDMDDAAEEMVKECYRAMAIEAYKIAVCANDSIF